MLQSCRENQNTHFFMFCNFYPRKSRHLPDTVEKMVEPDSLQITILRMRVACWITKATDTHSEYVILIAFPRQQW